MRRPPGATYLQGSARRTCQVAKYGTLCKAIRLEQRKFGSRRASGGGCSEEHRAAVSCAPLQHHAGTRHVEGVSSGLDLYRYTYAW